MKFVFDLDGTICFKGQSVSERILKSLEKLEAQGHQVIFASARPIRDLLPVLDKRFHTYPMIGGNGAIVANQGQIISTVHFDTKTLLKIKRLIELYEVTYLIDSSWDYAYTGPADHPILHNLDPQKLAKNRPLTELNPIVKILMLTSKKIGQLKRDLAKLDVVVNVHGNEGVLDISPKGINKWSGLQQLAVIEGEYIAFGNDANDVSMFQHAKHSVMIGDHSKLKPFAEEQLPIHDDIEKDITEKVEELARFFH
ncbi:HAD-IIB family hydrolase [Caldifermentibacillus hisashii]|uniref:HAD-IIB family hydrolase n=1 Tax=Caldifermentibacillus hisashii TaxID=996558 RepID=UPI003D2385D5